MVFWGGPNINLVQQISINLQQTLSHVRACILMTFPLAEEETE